MAAFAYSAINAQGLELKGEIHATDPAAAREQLRIRGLLARKLNELPASGDNGVRSVFKAVKPKSPDLLAPVRDDDRRRPQRRGCAGDPRGADRRRVPGGGREGATRRRRRRAAAVAGD